MPIPLSTLIAASVAASLAFAPDVTVRRLATGGYANTVSAGIAAGTLNNHATLWIKDRTLDVHPAGFSFSAINGRTGALSVGFAGTSTLSQTPIAWVDDRAQALPVPFDYVYGRATATDGVQIVGSASETDPERGVGASHALLWDLPSGVVTDLGTDATVSGVGGGAQVGWQNGSRGPTAALWRGTQGSFVDLHPQGQDVSVASDTDGTIQVGYVGVDVRVRHEGRPRDIRFYAAGVWDGTPESFTYLPSPYRHSFATAICAGIIVGYGNTSDAIGTPQESRAVAWVGPDHAFVDLHALLPPDMRTSRATDVDAAGNIAGYGVTSGGAVRSFVWSVAAPPRRSDDLP
ncbi:MAG: hypothetical protein DYG92_10750 [Leptolyngbya sp. PLA1]|nr:hypothetical protein [Leptolyngbya sp. PLA1]